MTSDSSSNSTKPKNPRSSMFDKDKAIEAILYVADRVPNGDLYKTLKVLLFADRSHLEKHGRFITGDTYLAMEYGPVPSNTYDIIKHVRGDGAFGPPEAIESFQVEGRNIIPSRPANEELFSISDLKCIEESLEENKDLGFTALKEKSHDHIYKSADYNGTIGIEDFAKELPNSQELLEYLANTHP